MADEDSPVKSGPGKTAYFFILLAVLLVVWRGDNLVANFDLLFNAEATMATIENKTSGRKQRGGEREAFYYYFLYGSDTIRGKTNTFAPFMTILTDADENDEQIFEVAYHPDDFEGSRPMGSVWVSWLFDIVIMLAALLSLFLARAAFTHKEDSEAE